MPRRKSSYRGTGLDKPKANLVNRVQFRIASYISNQIHITNYLFPNWVHEDSNLNFYREQSKFITLSEAKLILEGAAGRAYHITSVIKRIIRCDLGMKSNGKKSQWLIDKELLEKFIERSRAE